MTVPSLRPEPRRHSERGHRENGWYIARDPQTGEEKRWMRATTFAHLMSDDAAVARWRRRKVAEGLARTALDRAEAEGIDPAPLTAVVRLADAIEAASDDWRKAKALKLDLDDLCEGLAEAAGTARGSSAGTDIHALTEWYDAGRIEEIEVPIEHAADLAAYIAAMQDSGIVTRPEWLERVIVNRATSTCGTTDKILMMPDGRVVIGDLKTQQSISFGWQEIAMQLAQYAYGDAMLADDGGLEPMPAGLDRAKGLVIWLPVGSGRVEFHEIDLAEGWDDCLFARDLLRRRARTKALGRRWVPLGAELAQITHLIREAPARASLRALITDAATRGLDTRDVRELANKRWEQLAA
jgi:hypothetical protein